MKLTIIFSERHRLDVVLVAEFLAQGSAHDHATNVGGSAEVITAALSPRRGDRVLNLHDGGRFSWFGLDVAVVFELRMSNLAD